LIVKGVNLVNVQRQLGHSSISVTVDTYTHWIESMTRGRVLDVDRLVEVGRPARGTEADRAANSLNSQEGNGVSDGFRISSDPQARQQDQPLDDAEE
jgi:hypothetical protein